MKKPKYKKRFVYLISPNKIKSEEFYSKLNQVLSTKKVMFFQLRLKKESFKNKIYIGEVDGVSSRINAETRSLLTRVKIENENFELVPGSLLEVTVKYNQRNSLGIPDTSILLEGNKAYVYKVSKDNIANRTEIKFRSRNNGSVEVISGLIEGDLIVAEGLKKVIPRSKIKPIKQ